MPISQAYTQSETVSTTEWSLVTDTAGPDAATATGEFQALIDVSALVIGDIYQFKVYEKIISGGTQRVVFNATIANAQPSPIWASPVFRLMHGWDMTLLKLAGADAAITWSIRETSSNLTHILGTALTETAGQIAAAFKQFFDVGTPTGTMKAITNVVTATNLTNAPTSGDLTATMKLSVNAEADTAISDAALATAANLAIVAGYLDTEVASILAAVDTEIATLVAELAKVPKSDAAVSWNATALAAIGDAAHDEVVEGSLTHRQITRLVLAALAGKLNGAATVTVNIRDNADTKNRIVATVDADGNRSAVTLDAT